MFDDVKGLISDQDRKDLETFAVLAGEMPGDYLEVGSYQGSSTLHILKGMPEDRTLFCVDYWGQNYTAFRNNIRRYGQWDRVAPLSCDFRTAPKFFEKTQRLPFIFVDNDHTYSSTALPVLLFWDRLTPGGYMLFHDYCHPNYPGLTEFLHRFELESWNEIARERNGLFCFRKTDEIPAAFVSEMEQVFAQNFPQDLPVVKRTRQCQYASTT